MAACRMTDLSQNHIPVMLSEAITNLMTSPDGIYVDATFGRGSHSQAILNALSPQGRLIAFDKDHEAVHYANATIKDPRFRIYHASFARMNIILQELKLLGEVSGILFDLGVSSPQLDNPARGFSFMREGPLDMRMDTSSGVDAATWLSKIDEAALADVLWQYGEEKASRRIAKAIVKARLEAPITTTKQLTDIIARVMPRSKKPHDKHPATRTFQAIRIAVNQELNELLLALPQALEALKIGGRLCAISFHSLEDRLVKTFIREQEKGRSLPRGLPIKGMAYHARLISIGKAIKPGLTETHSNPRARSAILRIAEKIL